MQEAATGAAMERMSTLDAGFFFVEHKNVPMHPGSLTVFEGHNVRISVAIFSYLDRFSFGITADYSTAPDLDVLTKGIRRGLAELQAQSAAARRAADPARAKRPADLSTARRRPATAAVRTARPARAAGSGGAHAS